jgi:hypothetical protein
MGIRLRLNPLEERQQSSKHDEVSFAAYVNSGEARETDCHPAIDRCLHYSRLSPIVLLSLFLLQRDRILVKVAIVCGGIDEIVTTISSNIGARQRWRGPSRAEPSFREISSVRCQGRASYLEKGEMGNSLPFLAPDLLARS